MGKLHYFFPENDLALARNLEHYTAPPAAAQLRRSGQTLALWYGDSSDQVYTDGINAEWLRRIRSCYGISVELFTSYSEKLTPAPWGWSKASRHALRLIGVPDDNLPSDTMLDRLRELSHRRTASLIANVLAHELPFAIAPAAQELRSADEIKAYVASTGLSVLKLPWSSSGRGLIPVSPADLNSRLPQLEAAIKRQGCIMGEPRMEKRLDFAMLFTMDCGKCRYDGLSVFRTENFGAYAGNILASQTELDGIVRASGINTGAISSALIPILEDFIGSDYQGPLGIDMMAVEGAEYTVAPAIELNLRNTMGHVSRILAERYISQGARGIFSVKTDGAGHDDAVVHGTRISSGSVSLSAPCSPFSFEIKI